MNYKVNLGIIVLALFGTIIFLFLNFICKKLIYFRYDFLGYNLIYFIISGVIFAEIATFLCYKYAICAEGSGIPEIKTFLTGTKYE